MKAQVKVGRIAGISIGLHYSWFIIALLIALSLAQHFRAVAPQWSGIEVWMAAVITGLLFFATLLLHELAHSLVAKTRGLRVRAILVLLVRLVLFFLWRELWGAVVGVFRLVPARGAPFELFSGRADGRTPEPPCRRHHGPRLRYRGGSSELAGFRRRVCVA